MLAALALFDSAATEPKRQAISNREVDFKTPVISRFLRIAIAIVYRDYDPPHFHATYGEYEITVGIRDGAVTGRFPRRALVHVLE